MRTPQTLIKNMAQFLIVTVTVVLSILLLTLNIGLSVTSQDWHSSSESFALTNFLNIDGKSNSTDFSNYHTTPFLTPRYSNNPVNGNLLFNFVKEPAPMGIVDYGLSTPAGPHLFNAYFYSTAKFLGIITINSLLTQGNKTVGNSMSIQLNSMLVFNESERQYCYWIQDVAVLNTSSKYIFYEDNVWNSSWPRSYVYSSSISGKGEIERANSYYGFIAPTSNGSGIYINFPATISMEVISFKTLLGQPAVSFVYNDGYGWQNYDTVIFKFAHSASDIEFVVNGNKKTPAGTDFDAEFVLGGPGYGDTTNDLISNVDLQLDFWNRNNFQMIQNAFNFGSDTAETISNMSVSYGHFAESGSLFFSISGREGLLREVYTYLNTSTLTILIPFPAGRLTVGNQPYNFTGGELNLTLFPGTYPLELTVEQNNHWTYWNNTATLSAGKTTTILVPYHSVNCLIVGIVFSSLIVIATTIGACLILRRRRKLSQ